MLYDQSGNQVHVAHGKELSENQKRNMRETNEPLDHKGNKFFRIEERARFIK